MELTPEQIGHCSDALTHFEKRKRQGGEVGKKDDDRWVTHINGWWVVFVKWKKASLLDYLIEF
jgi:hypothetical protein